MSETPRCDHVQFQASVNVGRLTDPGGGAAIAYVADVRIRCVGCGEQFIFLAPAGMSPVAPRTSLDGTTLRAPIAPAAWVRAQRFAAIWARCPAEA